ncbi:hypothetical protein [Methanosphaerula subterraneus]|uniref:hypothetical protein n=1 Tax=Methanosphaerula subterraneus TaxID=3350244 RepID=UPI003F85BA99
MIDQTPVACTFTMNSIRELINHSDRYQAPSSWGREPSDCGDSHLERFLSADIYRVGTIGSDQFELERQEFPVDVITNQDQLDHSMRTAGPAAVST